MQIARLVAHARLRVSLRLPPSCASKIPATSGRGFEQYSSLACADLSLLTKTRLFSFSATGTKAQLGALKQAVWPIFCSGWRSQVPRLVVVTAATGYLSRINGLDGAVCEKDVKDSVWSSYSKDGAAKDQSWNDERALAAVWIKRLWFPALVVTTVFMGWHYPVSLVVNLIFVLWSTKPTPASIHIWAEQRRMEQQPEKRGFDRLRAQLTPGAVMHVEVEDYMLFCLARVSSLTQKSLVIGLLGDWWAIYSSSSSITAPGLGSFFPEKFFPHDKSFSSDI